VESGAIVKLGSDEILVGTLRVIDFAAGLWMSGRV
jgi:hypothetical protein